MGGAAAALQEGKAERELLLLLQPLVDAALRQQQQRQQQLPRTNLLTRAQRQQVASLLKVARLQRCGVSEGPCRSPTQQLKGAADSTTAAAAAAGSAIVEAAGPAAAIPSGNDMTDEVSARLVSLLAVAPSAAAAQEIKGKRRGDTL